MRYVRLGKSDLEVSRLGLDCHSLGVAQRERGWDPMSYDGQVFAIRTVHAALDSGINIFDTSSATCGARGEALLGKALSEKQADVLLASRAGNFSDSTEIEYRILASLRRLRAEHIDILYLSDRPLSDGCGDGNVNEDTLTELERLKKRGLIGHIGLLASEPLRATSLISTGCFDIVQMQCNVAKQGPVSDLLDTCVREDIGVSIIKPLASKTLKTVVSALDADWTGSSAVRECCLRFLLGDRRVQLINVGMRWEHEVMSNSRLFSGMDMACGTPTEPMALQAAQ